MKYIPPFSPIGAISALLEVTETIEIFQPFLTRTLIQMRILLLYMRKYGILANRKQSVCLG